MGKWEMVRLSDVVAEVIAGEWGIDCSDAEVGTKVLRTTNFTNSGQINYFNVVKRNIPANKVQKKKLKRYDIILEKSGGSDNQPVGRVVFFDNDTTETYLCNNFTQVLRIKRGIAFPKCIFLYLFRMHQNGTTELLQNKTTGIRNLQVKQYMALEIPLPPLTVQQQIVDVLDRASALIEKRKAQIEKLDLLVKSQFIEMFGDLKRNSKNWAMYSFACVAIIDTKMTNDFKLYATYPHIGIESIEKDTGRILDYKLVKDSDLKSGKYLFDERHLIYSKIRPNLNKVAKPSFKGVCSADAYPILPTKRSNRDYLAIVMRSDYFLDYILAFSGRTNIPKVNKHQLEGFYLPMPPISLQNEFAIFVQQVEVQKSLLQQSLTKLEAKYKSLMQKCFRGEIY